MVNEIHILLYVFCWREFSIYVFACNILLNNWNCFLTTTHQLFYFARFVDLEIPRKSLWAWKTQSALNILQILTIAWYINIKNDELWKKKSWVFYLFCPSLLLIKTFLAKWMPEPHIRKPRQVITNLAYECVRPIQSSFSFWPSNQRNSAASTRLCRFAIYGKRQTCGSSIKFTPLYSTESAPCTYYLNMIFF